MSLRGGKWPTVLQALHGRARRLLCNRRAIDRRTYGRNGDGNRRGNFKFEIRNFRWKKRQAPTPMQMQIPDP